MRGHDGDNMLGRKARRDIRRDQIRCAAAIVMAGTMLGRSQSADAQAAGAQGLESTIPIPVLQAAADKGDARAQLQLGCLNAIGAGVPKDEAQALSWMTKAMSHEDGGYQGGVPAAEFAMAMCWKDANNRDSEWQWLMKSSDDGYVPAERVVSQVYSSGADVPGYLEKAVAVEERVVASSSAVDADRRQLVVLKKLLREHGAAVGEPSNEALVALFRDAYRKFGNDLASRSMGDIVASGYNKQQAGTGSQFRADDGATRALNGVFSAFGGENIMKARGAQFVNLADTGIITIKSRQLLEGNWIVYVNVRPRGEDRHWIEKMVVTRQDDRWVASLPAAAPIEQQ